MYCESVHTVVVVHALSELKVGAVDSYSVLVHVVRSLQVRSFVIECGYSSYCSPEHMVNALHSRFEVGVAAVDSYCVKMLHKT